VQVKKASQRDLILRHAFRHFAKRGFKQTTMAQIAAAARMTVANIYVYFPSKMHLLYELYRPMLTGQLESLAAEVRALATPDAKVRRLLAGIWCDLAASHNGFANNLMQALAEADPRQGKADRGFLDQCERFVSELLRECLPPDRRHLADDARVATFIWMAFDGFVINWRLGDTRNSAGVAELVADLILDQPLAATRGSLPRVAARAD
jgi:AcrR family transcriptional regulator